MKKAIRITCKGAALVPLSKLEPLQPESFKTLSTKDYGRLKAAILDVGFSFPELVWKHGGRFYVVDGHQRVRAVGQMIKEGHALQGGKLPVSFTEARNKKEAYKKIAMGSSQYGKYDEDAMYEFMHLAGLDLSELKEWGALPQIHMGKLEVGWFKDEDPKADEVPEPPKKAVTKPGDLWVLGDHLLLCGSSSKRADLKKLMREDKAKLLLTDPPYGKLKIFDSSGKVGRDNAAKCKEYGKYEGEGEFDLRPVLDASKGFYELMVVWGGQYFSDIFEPRTSWLVWDKRAGEHSWFSDAELAWTNLPIPVKLFKYTWQGMIREGQEIEREHPTQKPVPLMVWVLEMCKEAKTVLDLFLGSGTTMIAAEKLNRRCYGIEIEPRYVDVCVERWQEYTGKKAKRKR